MNIKISVGLVYGGRLPELMPYWIQNVIDDFQEINIKPQLIIVNNTNKPLAWLKENHHHHFSDILILPGVMLGDFVNERQRRICVSTLLADCCNLVLENASGNLIHFREDDMITTTGSFKKMFNFITDDSRDSKRAGVGALYQNRHGSKKNKTPFCGNISKPVKVDYTGTGCLLFWADLAPKKFYPTIRTVLAHDWRFGVDLRSMGHDLYLLRDATCKHHTNSIFEFVEPCQQNEINSADNYSRLRDEKQ